MFINPEIGFDRVQALGYAKFTETVQWVEV
jgi:hypothetical protein